MALVTCPSCKKIVDNTSGNCPNCGKPLRTGQVDKRTPAGKFKMISSVLITVSFVLMLVELFDISKTYVGGMLLGMGFIFHGLSQAKLEKDEGYIGKRKILIIYVLGVVFFIAGAVFFYIGLK